MSKIGRPKVKHPCRNIVGCKLNDPELKKLDKYCEKHNCSKSYALKEGLKLLLEGGVYR